MSDNSEYAAKAQETFSAERKEDIFVLILSTIAVALVMTGVIDKDTFKSLFF